MYTANFTGLVAIDAATANIIARFDDAELVAVLSANGAVALFAEDDGVLLQMCGWTSNAALSPVEIATRLLAA